MNRKFVMIAAAFLALAMLSIPFSVTVKAEPRRIVTRDSFMGKWYTQIDVVLGNANNMIRIPDDWNGMLVVLCRGYTSTVDPNNVVMDSPSKMQVSEGFATAASTYGEGGYCIETAMIRTHQLTEYVLNNYDVTGKVFLIGYSMGGNIALLLGAKYPELYDGVLDVSGTKDIATQYETKMHWAGLSNSELIAALTALNIPVPPFPFSDIPQPLPIQLAIFRDYSFTSAADIAVECGGTPENKPKAYEKVSPTYHADIEIPMITLQGAQDGLVILSQSLMYENAVVDAGSENFYRLVVIPNGGHLDQPIQMQIPIYFPILVQWVLTGIPPP